jgi:hypothetical protein
LTGDWCKFCIHLRCLNARHFGNMMLRDKELRSLGHLQWHDLPPAHRQMGRRTDRQTTWWSHKPRVFFKQSGLRRLFLKQQEHENKARCDRGI